METSTMGRVVVPATIENLADQFGFRDGTLAESEVRRVEVPDALIDTGAFGLLMPLRLVHQLGLDPVRTRTSRTNSDSAPVTTYRAARLTIQGRDFITDVQGIADHHPVIVGRLALLAMDWVVDVKGQRLIGNPEHGGEDMVDIL